MSASLFADRIKALRSAYKLTQEQFAERVGISREQVSKWESGKHAAPTKTIHRICEGFGITEEQFWNRDWLPDDRPKAVNTARPMTAGPYLGVPTDEKHMAFECPRCGATDFSPRARYCRGCAFPLYNFCMHPVMEERHVNPSDAAFCEVCARPTFWSREYVTLDEILDEPAQHSTRSAEEEHSRA